MTTLPTFERSIVVVDDNADDLLLTSHLLRRSGMPHRVETFTRSVIVLQHLQNEIARTHDLPGAEPPIAIVEAGTPLLDGFAFIEAVRAMPGGRAATLIMLSGSPEPGDRARALEAGADEYLVKFPKAETLRRALEIRRSVDV